MTTLEAWAQSTDMKLLALDNDGKIPLYDPASGTVTMLDLWVCRHCGRATTTGLCGCPSPVPSRSGS